MKTTYCIALLRSLQFESGWLAIQRRYLLAISVGNICVATKKGIIKE